MLIMRTFFALLLFIMSCAHLTAQRHLRLNSNKQISLYGAQVLAIKFRTIRAAWQINWNLQAHQILT